MNKPTKEELKSWDKLLQEEGLGMERGHNSSRLNYGFKDGASLIRTWDDVRIHIAQKRKIHKAHKQHIKHERQCAVCGTTFFARAKSLCCSPRCRKRRSRASQIFSTT